MGERTAAKGEIFDRAVELSDDLPGFERLCEESSPISSTLKRILFPNLEHRMEANHRCSSGFLDPTNLAAVGFSPAVFKRYQLQEIGDPRGHPVLLIACDASASLSNDQMRMTKVMAASWLTATSKSGVCVLAGRYHSGEVRQGVSGPLIQWIAHPCKSVAASKRDAIRALVALPDKGTGAQSDALSIAFMLEEAKRLARGSMIYLILISDCAWNQSFNTEKNGKEKVRAFFESAHDDLNGKLNTTLVALGVSEETGFEDLLEKVVKVSEENLRDYAAVAEQIGVYVASCIRERRRPMGRR